MAGAGIADVSRAAEIALRIAGTSQRRRNTMRAADLPENPRRVATTATTRPPGAAGPRNQRDLLQAQEATPQRLDASTRPCSNRQSLWREHKAETRRPRHSKPS